MENQEESKQLVIKPVVQEATVFIHIYAEWGKHQYFNARTVTYNPLEKSRAKVIAETVTEYYKETLKEEAIIKTVTVYD